MLLGIDEVGRGPWAGPLAVGAVILGPKFATFPDYEAKTQASCQPESLDPDTARLYQFWQSLTDSKKLTAKRRTELSQTILAEAAATGLGWVSAAEIDRYGLAASLKLATRRAVKQVLKVKVPFDEIIIDGTTNFLRNTPLEDRVATLKKADLLVKEVSAASIIAKVARDNYMVQLSQTYPAYGFEQHVGYGTALHRLALEQHGLCPEHRRSFRPIAELAKAHEPRAKAPGDAPESTTNFGQNITNSSRHTKASGQNTTDFGQRAELIVAEHLEQRLGHIVIAHNFKTKTCEIDLVSTCDDKIYFTEVKYRKDADHGTALEQITPAKYEQMRYAAERFLAQHAQYRAYQPRLAAGTVVGADFQFEDWFTLD